MTKKCDWDDVGLEKGLEQCEIETGFYFSRAFGGKAVINSNDPAIVSRLVNCNFFEIENYRTENQGRKQILVYVDGTIPIGAINIGKPRASDSINKVVKAPKKVYTEAEKKKNRELIAKRLKGNAG
ncbi:MAG: hypothetical protein KKD44_29370 [Proteobacteria bacterium]|nr:hypothetical protein [Pseudomonadota bacterium]